jgi:transmembrane sensor
MPSPARKRNLARTLAAASLLVAAGAAAGAVAGVRWIRPTTAGFGVEEFVTGKHQMASAQLGDGSVVRLAPHSRLRIVGSKNRRDLWLDGRAFFAVAKDADRPFVVHTPVGEAVALGTRFELNSSSNTLTLVMLQGRVALSANGGTTEVKGGEVGTVARGSAPTVVNVSDVYPMLDWVGEFLAFEATPLRDVGAEIGQRYNVKVHIDDPELASRTVTAWFTDESLQEVVAVVCRVVNARCTISGSNVDIRRPPTASGAG